ncbi:MULTISPECIES: copper resistance CopC/CopD family protein [Bradyrhizobium]|jgi:copper transport protein|uniref:copper resistance CopC/CopD family protein n=1 Tax=Bradyrhizobium TaxID=374 RepID=UPI0004898A15|nr:MULTISPECIES: CopD family protein [Bradyrhizobium]MCS3449680.1 copper transport protein [Bradyrhizobium elkanii]MCS3559177.1 copper transport protein [Bradyrhizobium elkanii]MCW2150977.1 copper transport protein [Bradyrhizobium elkanii]MCW2374708.1 copper transport protein [Bradyrhizobium elkanii]MDI2106898.1 CopD family protein [Bradyrhizobium sp. Mp64]
MRLVANFAALLVALCLATSAHAHAVLIGAEPADGSVVAEAPKMVVLRFNEAVAPTAVSLLDAAGKPRDVAIRAVDQSVMVTLPAGLPKGTQVVSYRVVSQDGHPVAGSLLFSIGVVTGSAAPSSDGVLDVLIWLARLGLYLGLFAGVGGVFFAAWIGQGSAGEPLIMWSLKIGLVGAIASLGLQGVDLLNLPLSGIVTWAAWASAAGTSLFPELLLAIAAMLIAAIAWRSPSFGAAFTTAIAMICVGLSFAVSGHAATASPQWLTRTALFIHGVGLAFWMGALAPLAVLAWQRKDSLLRVLRHFSTLAVPVVALIALSGLALAIVQLESFHALIDTGYGNILVAKLVLVVLLLGLAALNRLVFTPAIAREFHRTRPLQRSIALEFVLMIAILGLVALWRFTPPPRVLAMSADVPLAVHIHTDAAMFQVLIAPGKVGPNDFVLQLMSGDASPFAAKEATLTLSLPERGIEPMERAAARGADGYWHVRKVPLPVPGRWHMQIDALVTDFKKVTLEDDFEVR